MNLLINQLNKKYPYKATNKTTIDQVNHQSQNK